MRVLYLQGCDVTYAKGYESDDSTNEALLEEAAECALKADQVILFIGNFLPLEDDDFNRKDICLLPGMQMLVEKITAVNPNCVIVLAGGEVCEMPWRHRAKALLLTWFTGEGMGEAVAQILFGKKSPSGRLSATIPERLCDTPAYLSFDGNIFNIPYAEDIYVGYRYYDKKQAVPAYPFGYGLSYAEFNYSHLNIEREGQNIRVSVDVTNNGNMTAKEVVQLYIAPQMPTRLPRPVRELKAFAKVEISPGATKSVCMELTERDFAYYDPDVKDWVVENGSYAIEIGHSSRDIVLSQLIDCSGSRKVKPLAYDCGFYELFQYPAAKEMFYDFMIEQGLVSREQVNEELEKGIIWSFWPVRTFLDMNSNGAVSFEDFNRFIDRVNSVIC